MLYNRYMAATTRDQILETLRQTRDATVSDLAMQLHTTPANIRYHLDLLLVEAAIEPMPPDPSQSRPGRPAARFRLSQKSKPNDLAQFSQEILTLFLSGMLPDDQTEKLDLIASERVKQVHLDGSSTQQLNQALDFLNQHAYQARWEARRLGPEIRFGNCPFHAILSAHPELCEVDRRMLEVLLPARVILQEHIQVDVPTPHACLFRLQFLAQLSNHTRLKEE